MPSAGGRPTTVAINVTGATRMPDDDLLRLVALDAEDLAILSAHVQDAVLKVGDITWLPRTAPRPRDEPLRLGEVAGARGAGREYQRRRSALHFARVARVQSTGIDRSAPETVLELLAIRSSRARRLPATSLIEFAGDATLRACGGGARGRSSPISARPGRPTHAPRHPASADMAVRLDSGAPDFEARFAALLGAKREVSEDVEPRGRGDRRGCAPPRRRRGARLHAAVRPLQRRHAERLAVVRGRDRRGGADVAARRSATRSSSRATASSAYHAASSRATSAMTDALGVELGQRWTAVEAVGIYVPGGTAAYPVHPC